jgi:hypothetical protein
MGGRVAQKLSAADLHRLARMGAAARLDQLEREIAALRRAFPGLKPPAPPVPVLPAGAAPAEAGARGNASAAVSRRRRRKPMSAAERKAVSERMKRYWDARRKAADK